MLNTIGNILTWGSDFKYPHIFIHAVFRMGKLRDKLICEINLKGKKLLLYSSKYINMLICGWDKVQESGFMTQLITIKERTK
jgi:hypothetical protein